MDALFTEFPDRSYDIVNQYIINNNIIYTNNTRTSSSTVVCTITCEDY